MKIAFKINILMLVWLVVGLPAHAVTVTLNLKDADIGALISTVAEVTDRNFIVDPRVKGKVTVISSRPMDSEEVYQVFLSILKVHGFSPSQRCGHQDRPGCKRQAGWHPDGQ